MAGYINGGGNNGSANLTPHSVGFLNTDTITISHSLSYYPSIWIVLTTGAIIEAAITYSSGSFTIALSTALSGTVYYR